MNLNEHILRINSIIEQTTLTGGTSDNKVNNDTVLRLKKDLLYKPAKLMPLNIDTHINKINPNDNGSVRINFKNGMYIDLSQDGFSALNLKIPLIFNLNHSTHH